MILSSYAQNINELQVIKRPADFEILSAPDSLGMRSPLKQPSHNKNNILLPYPIIFIHGLNSNCSTWDSLTNFMDAQYGFTFGGRFDFCLNYDGDNTIANTNFWPTIGADLALYTDYANPAQVVVGDYYYLNFGVGSNGSVFPTNSDPNYVLSEQSAITKQGMALKWAICYVLYKTGRDKVVLMGHSMGGLASRQYMQNLNLWQPDGDDHVAKLITTGTPHGGSNSSMSILSELLTGVCNEAEAVRDLRSSYYYSEDNGVFLYGGYETDTVMDDILLYDFYNVDVNCNGIEGEYVTGLNQKTIYNDLDYTCIIGDCSGCVTSPGDGVVSSYNADLNNFYSGLNINMFYYYASAMTQIHTDLPSQIYLNMQGLDEPNEYVLSYNIGFDTTYTAFTTVQPDDGYIYDYDDFKFSVPVQSNVNVSINSIFLADLMVRIVNLAGNVVGTTIHSAGSYNINYTQVLNAGDYYIEIYGTPTLTSYLYPYNFRLSKTPVTSALEMHNVISDLLVYPNPAKSQLNIDIETIDKNLNFEILNSLGQVVYKSTLTNLKTTIDIDNFSSGVYLIKFDTDKSNVYYKFIKE